MSSNKALIFSAPSGAGKTTLVRHLLKKGLPLAFSVSACSRAPRPNEVDGKDYHFLKPEEFRKHIEQGAFLEWEEVYKDMFYGTLRAEVERIWASGKHLIFDVDVVRGINLKQQLGKQALSVFVAPPSLEVLKNRLNARGTESSESLNKRLDKAEEEMSHQTSFDTVIVNDDLHRACEETLSIVSRFLNP